MKAKIFTVLAALAMTAMVSAQSFNRIVVNIEKGSDELKREELQKSLAAARFEYENRKKAFDELIGRTDRIKSVERDRVHDAGVMRVEGDDIVDAHDLKFFQCQRTIK